MKTVILVPCALGIEWNVDEKLRILEYMGYEVWRIPGWSAIDQCRNNAIWNAVYVRDFESVLFIDGDVLFEVDDVVKITNTNYPIIGGAYPFKGYPNMTVQPYKGQRIIFDKKEGGLYEVMCLATGFLYIKSAVFKKLEIDLELPRCNTSFSATQIPFFKPDVWNIDGQLFYLGEDFSFCMRARQCGYQIILDSTIKLGHIGKYCYEWEDVVNGVGKKQKESDKLIYEVSNNNTGRVFTSS